MREGVRAVGDNQDSSFKIWNPFGSPGSPVPLLARPRGCPHDNPHAAAVQRGSESSKAMASTGGQISNFGGIGCCKQV